MILNSTIINKIFLPLTVIFLAFVAGEPSAKAEAPNAIDAQSSIANPILRSTKAKKPTGSHQVSQQLPQRVPQRIPQRVNAYRIALAPKASALQATPGTVITRGATLLGQPSIRSSDRVAINVKRNSTGTATPSSNFTSGSNVRLAQSPQPRLRQRSGAVKLAQTSPSDPSTTTPGTTTPGTTTPGTTTPETTQPASPTEISPGRRTRSGSSYIGVGGNIGIGSGDTALGEGSFAVISKIGLTRQFSVRPSVLFTDDVTILVPVTFDFIFGEGPTDDLSFTAAPYLGVGAAISTGDGADVGLLLTGGIDVPLSPQFTATASVNASVTGESAVGVLLGVGYNFAGF
jgi:hypothetical protein